MPATTAESAPEEPAPAQLVAFAARCIRSSLHSQLVAFAARCIRSSLHSQLVAFAARCIRSSLHSQLLPTGSVEAISTFVLLVYRSILGPAGWMPSSTRWPQSASGKEKEKPTLSPCSRTKRMTVAQEESLLSPLPATPGSHRRWNRILKAFWASSRRSPMAAINSTKIKV